MDRHHQTHEALHHSGVPRFTPLSLPASGTPASAGGLVTVRPATGLHLTAHEELLVGVRLRPDHRK